MATGNNRDVTMTLSVETLGQKNIKTLQDAVAALAKEGGDAAPEFEQLANEIGRIGEQAQAIAAFKELALQTEALADKQQSAATKAAELADKLQLASTAAQAAAVNQKAASAELLAAQKAYDVAATGIKNLNAETDAAGRKADDYRTKLSALTAEQGEQRNQFVELRAELKQANTTLSEAEAAQSKLTTQVTRADTALAKTTQAITAHNSALRDSAEAAAKLGASTDNIATSEAALLQSLNATRTAALARAAAAQEMAESDRLLAIEARGMAELYERGRVALIAEETGLREAARASIAYTAARQAEEQARVDAAAAWQREAVALVDAAEAVQKLKVETQQLEDAERTLAANNAFEKQHQEAKKLTESAQYVRELGQALDKLEADQAQAAASATQAAATISNAFRTIGVRSAEELRAEIVQVRAAMQTVQATSAQTGSAMAGAFSAGQARIKELERDIRAATGSLTMADKAAGLLKNSLGQITAGNIVADGVGYLVEKVKAMSAAFLAAIVQGDQLRRGLNAIYKDAAITASQIDFLRKSSSESGVAFGSLSGEFLKFSASMHNANIPIEQSNGLFRAVTAASASLGIGAEATAGALNALGQMASKGVVSLEELRQQLGDRLPGAMGLAADGLGLTEAQLIKLIESGGLATRDFIVPFTMALGKLKGETDGLVPSWERLKGALTEVAQGMGDAGWTTIFIMALKAVGTVLGVVALGVSQLTEGLYLLSTGMRAYVLSLFGGTEATQKFWKEVAESGKRLEGQRAAFMQMINPVEAVAAAMANSTKELVNSINANTSLTNAQKLAALSAGLAANATLDMSAKMVQYNVAAAEFIKSQAGQTEAFSKLAKAAKEQGDTLVFTTKLIGDSTAVQIAETEAARLYSAAIDKVAVSQAAENEMLVAQKKEIAENAAARGLTAREIKVQNDALDGLITTSQAEMEQTLQTQAAAKAALFTRELETAALKDNSKAIGDYAAMMQSAAKEVERLQVMQAAGIDVTNVLIEAQARLTTATYLHRDALKDAVTAQQLLTKEQTASLQLAIAQAESVASHYTALANEARALGDTEKATRLDMKAKQEMLVVMRLKLQLAELEQAAALLEIDLKRKTIDGTTEEGKVKLKLLDIETQMIKIKQAGNLAAQDTIKAVEDEIKAIKNGTSVRDASKSSIDRETGSRHANTQAVEAFTSAAGKQLAAQAAELNMHGQLMASLQALTDARREDAMAASAARFEEQQANNSKSVTQPTKLGTYNNAKSGGASEELALALAAKYGIDPGDMKTQYDYNAFAKELGEKVLIEKRNAAASAAKDAKTTPSTPATPTTTPATPAAPSNNQTTTQTVNVRITMPNGSTQTVQTTPQGSSTLQSIIAELTSARRSSGL